MFARFKLLLQTTKPVPMIRCQRETCLCAKKIENTFPLWHNQSNLEKKFQEYKKCLQKDREKNHKDAKKRLLWIRNSENPI